MVDFISTAEIGVEKHSLDPDGPTIGVSWVEAVAYCNWLSKQEGLPDDQWCYLRNEKGEYEVGMTIPGEFLKRKGYRLPIEAEWEYAWRAGAITSRYHGLSVDLLLKYASYAANSAEHASPGGTLLPNDLGLFDILGNVFEWCDEPDNPYATAGNRAITDITNMSPYVDNTPRLLRSGALIYLPTKIRSADRHWGAPSIRFHDSGFRLAVTHN
jgi:formylglycine-generating enzyme required for sulfatase activity